MRLPERRPETPHAVLEQGPRCTRSGGGEEGQDEGVRVPEDVSSIARACKPTGTERRFPVLPNRSRQLEEREPDRALELGIVLDPDVGDVPELAPGRPLLGEEPLEAHVLCIP